MNLNGCIINLRNILIYANEVELLLYIPIITSFPTDDILLCLK